MKKIIKLCLLIHLLFSLPSPAQADNQPDMNEQAQQMLKTADDGLNKVYKAILEERKDDANSIAAIRQSQRDWLMAMEAEISKAFPLEKDENPREVYGSSYPAEYAEIRTGHILERIKLLQKIGGKSAFSLDNFYKTYESMRDVDEVAEVAAVEPKPATPIDEKKNAITPAGMWIAKFVTEEKIVEKYVNSSGKAIKAFRIIIDFVDDFGDVKSTFTTQYDSTVLYCSGAASSNNHVIKPGEAIYIQTRRVNQEALVEAHPNNPFLRNHEVIVSAYPNNPFLRIFGVQNEKELPAQIQPDSKKIRFRLDKVAYEE